MYSFPFFPYRYWEEDDDEVYRSSMHNVYSGVEVACVQAQVGDADVARDIQAVVARVGGDAVHGLTVGMQVRVIIY